MTNHFLLFCEARRDGGTGVWRFVLAQVGASASLTATDTEPDACRERLELLALVRGLEAIDRPARVTLVTESRYISRGLKRGLAEWRANHWQWERFGQLVPVRDCDLWRRVDRALQFHQVDCRMWRFDGYAEPARRPAQEPGESVGGRLAAVARERWRRAAAAWGGAFQGAGLAAS
jgi:ribonuclease HI